MIAKQSLLTTLLTQMNIVFNIPVYQRRYSWEEEQCQQLFDDLKEIANSGKNHFIGSIVYIPTGTATEPSCNIIDGQQRITSVMLFLKALYDLSDSEATKKLIRTGFFVNEGLSSNFNLKLKQVEADGTIYEKLIMHDDFDESAFSDAEKATNVYKNYIYFKSLIAQSSCSQKDLLNAVYKIGIIDVCLNDEDPQKVFESMNSTGKSLTNTDLLRNYLLMDLPYNEQETLYKKYWMQIENNVSVKKMENYMVHYLIMSHKSDNLNLHGKSSHINKDTLYEAYKINYSPKDKGSEKILEDMYKYSVFYKRIVNNDNIKTELDMAIDELINKLGAEPAAIFIMYLLSIQKAQGISDGDMLEAIRACISYVFRVRIFKGSISNQFFGRAIQYYDDSKADNFIDKVWDALNFGQGSYRFPRDKEFKEAFESKNIYLDFKSPMIQYILYKYEKLNTKEIVTPEKATIEHIMPQNFTLWQEHLDEIGDADYSEYINKIGNLTLTKLNSELSNAPFEDKKAIYKDSGYKMTRDIAEYADWNSAEIKKRSADMAETALKLWPLPEVYNNSDNNATYKFEDNKLLDALRNAVKNYDASAKEDVKKSHINFIINEKIIFSVLIAQKFLFVDFTAHKEQLTPNDILEDISTKNHWGVGNSRMKVTKEKDISQVIDYIKQMIDLKLV